MNQIIKLGIGLAVAGLLTACGPDGDSGGGEEKGIISKGGECVDIPIHRKLNVESRLKIKASGIPESFAITKLLKANKDLERGYSGTDEYKVYFERKIYLQNNYLHVTENKYEAKLNNGEVTGKGGTMYFSPYYIREASGKVCKGQSWIDSFKESTKIDGMKEAIEKRGEITSSIEDINVLKTVEAGEFNTYIWIRESNADGVNRKIKYWVDIKTGWEVYTENYKNGKLLSTTELIEFN